MKTAICFTANDMPNRTQAIMKWRRMMTSDNISNRIASGSRCAIRRTIRGQRLNNQKDDPTTASVRPFRRQSRKKMMYPMPK